MTTVAYRAPGTLSGLGAWDEWVAEVGMPAVEEAGWALRTLAQGLLVALAWPLRLAWLLARQARWGSGETLFCTVLAAGPIGLLIKLYPRVVWPTFEQALVDLQRAAVVLTVAWLVLYLRAGAQGSGGGRSCGCMVHAGARHLVPSPDGTKTWRWIVSLHEAGHLVIGKRLGRRTGKARIRGRGGLTQVWPDHSDIVGEVAIDMAGVFAAGTTAGDGGDRANAHWRLRKFVAPKRRGAVMTAGTAKARSMVATHRGEIERTARRIHERGWTT